MQSPCKAGVFHSSSVVPGIFRGGAYPIAQEKYETPWHELADYLNETVIERAIQHDLRMGPRGQKRDEKLLEEVFSGFAVVMPVRLRAKVYSYRKYSKRWVETSDGTESRRIFASSMGLC